MEEDIAAKKRKKRKKRFCEEPLLEVRRTSYFFLRLLRFFAANPLAYQLYAKSLRDTPAHRQRTSQPYFSPAAAMTP